MLPVFIRFERANKNNKNVTFLKKNKKKHTTASTYLDLFQQPPILFYFELNILSYLPDTVNRLQVCRHPTNLVNINFFSFLQSVFLKTNLIFFQGIPLTNIQ